LAINKESAELEAALTQSAGYLLSQSSRIFGEKMSRALKALDLSLYEFVTLRLISLDAPITQSKVGETYGIDRTTMVAIIDRLEAGEMVTREKNPQDRRSYRLRLTVKGKKILARARQIAAKEQQDFLSPITSTEWESLRKTLWKLVSSAQAVD
jgi:MarR family transcriptional regulator, transcriptional regulator for hemolysin